MVKHVTRALLRKDPAYSLLMLSGDFTGSSEDIGAVTYTAANTLFAKY